MKIKKRGFPGALTTEVSEAEIAHRALSRRAATEGIVLLRNDGVLPLQAGAKVALYGDGARHTVKGGTGSGDVNSRDSITVDLGLRAAGLAITTDGWLDEYDARYRTAHNEWITAIKAYVRKIDAVDALFIATTAHPFEAPDSPEVRVDDETDTAIFVISRVSGESGDRKPLPGDYYLSACEERLLAQLTVRYAKVIAVLNVGGVIDTSWLDRFPVQAVVLLSQAGSEGGSALADVLLGKVNPSGRLTDTWAYDYADYPSSASYLAPERNRWEEKYQEGIYVGYRYFDTFDVRPRYRFGFGLSYTEFVHAFLGVAFNGAKIQAQIRVRNTGTLAGKEVVQLYAACPPQARGSEKVRLVAFGKTALLSPGAEETLTLEFLPDVLTTYHGGQSCWLLPAGTYYLFDNFKNDADVPVAALTLETETVLQKTASICPLQDALAELKPDFGALSVWHTGLQAADACTAAALDPAVQAYLADRAAEQQKRSVHLTEAKGIVSRLTLQQKATLACGMSRQKDVGTSAKSVPGAAGETTDTLEAAFNIPSLVLADGPAGLRLQQCYEEDPATGSVYCME